jgi:hypothetical protein
MCSRKQEEKSMTTAAQYQDRGSVAQRNPFGVMDVPDPNDSEVQEFARGARLAGNADDVNAASWAELASSDQYDALEGDWSSRWNGGADPTIAGDAPDKWKAGLGRLKIAGDRVYILFDWDGGRRKGLIDARREDGNRLVGKYINLGTPTIMCPWIGLIVDTRRIDGCWSGGRIDFRR